MFSVPYSVEHKAHLTESPDSSGSWTESNMILAQAYKFALNTPQPLKPLNTH